MYAVSEQSLPTVISHTAELFAVPSFLENTQRER